MLKNMAFEISEVFKYRNVVYSFVHYLLKARYRKSVFGFMWTVLAPMSHFILLSIVFTFAMRVQVENYVVYLLSGLIIFNFLSAVIGKSTDTFVDNEHFIKKIYIPKTVFILNIVFYEGVNFVGSILVLLIIGFILGHLQFGMSLFSVLIPVVASVFFLSGLGMVIGIASVYSRDLKHIVPSLMLIVFYLTPILYPDTILPDHIKPWLKYNVFYYFVRAFREPFVSGQLIGLADYGVVILSSLAFFLVGLFSVVKFGNRLVFKL